MNGSPCCPGPLNARWAVNNDPFGHLQLCLPFFHLCRQGEDVLLHMLIQRESVVSSCQMRVQSKSMITVKSSIWSEETDLVSKLLGLFGSRNP